MSQKLYTFNTGPHKNLASPGPESVDTFDAVAGVGKCLEWAMADAIYRGHLPTLHDKMIPIYEKITGNKRRVDVEKTKKAQTKAGNDNAGNPVKVSDVYETPVEFFNREYELATDSDKAAINDAVRALALAEYIDVSPSKREGGPKKAFIERATQVLTRDIDAIEAYVSNILAKNPNANIERDGDGKPTVASLALAIQQVVEEAQRAAAEALG